MDQNELDRLLVAASSDPLKVLDLAGQDLAGLRFQLRGAVQADLGGANLAEASFVGLPMVSAKFEASQLIKADFTRASLVGADFSNANLQGAILVGADASDANFENADLIGAWLRGASLNRASFYKARLCKTDLRGADLTNTTLVSADLREAIFEGTLLVGTNLHGANITGASFEGSYCHSITLPNGSRWHGEELPQELGGTQSMIKWQYKFLTTEYPGEKNGIHIIRYIDGEEIRDWSRPFTGINQTLADLGDDGWELAEVVWRHTQGWNDGPVYILKRAF